VAELRIILVVEDDEGNREALSELLEGEGYQVIAAANGQDALAWLRANPAVSPSLILLDMMMPVMNGTEFRMQQREDPQLAKIPVVLMSAGARIEEEATVLGAVGVIGKPPDVDDMLAQIEHYSRPPEQSR
jgi:CheY-like chemotaxis protein